MGRDPGTYVLVLVLEQHERVTVGALGALEFRAGRYLYVGSALGGLRARLARHLRATKRLHWHVDYLLQHAHIEAIWCHAGRERLECTWANHLAQSPGVQPAVHGFGASDCRCETHLFRCEAEPLPMPPGAVALDCRERVVGACSTTGSVAANAPRPAAPRAPRRR